MFSKGSIQFRYVILDETSRSNKLEKDFEDLCSQYQKKFSEEERLIHLIEFQDNKFIWNRYYDPRFYITRKFNKVAIDEKKLREHLGKNFQDKDIFLIRGMQKDDFPKEKIASTEYELNNNKPIFILSESDEEVEAKRVFDEKSLGSNNIHWIQKEGNNLIWKRSKGKMETISKLRKEEVPASDNSLSCKESDLLNIIENEKLVVIADVPGMGKSTTLIDLSKEYKESHAPDWVIKVNLRDCEKVINKFKIVIDEKKLQDHLKGSGKDINIFLFSGIQKDDFEKHGISEKVTSTKNELSKDKPIFILSSGDKEREVKEVSEIQDLASYNVHWIEKKDNKFTWKLTSKGKIEIILKLCKIDTIDIDTIDTVVSFLSDVDSEGMSHPLARELLKHKLSPNSGSGIFLSLDGFDEIRGNSQVKSIRQYKIIELLKLLKENTSAKVLIATRPYEQEKRKLEDELSVLSYGFNRISGEQGKNFIGRFWQNSLKLKYRQEDLESLYLVAEDLFKKSREIFGKELSSFIGVPLQVLMLAEAYLKNDKVLRTNPQILNNEDERKELLKDLSFGKLYKDFVDRKYEIYFDEKNRFSDVVSNNDKERLKKSYRKDHIRLAFKYYFDDKSSEHGNKPFELFFSDDNDRTFFKGKIKSIIESEETKDHLNRIGITEIKEISKEYKVDFIHRTFAEYFISELIFDRFEKKSSNPSYSQEAKERMWKFLLDDIFIEENYNVIRNFINSKLSDKQSVDFDTYFFDYEDIVNKLLKERVKKKLVTQLDVAAKEGLLQLTKFLLKNAPSGYVNSKSEKESYTSLHYAIISNHIRNVRIVETLLTFASLTLLPDDYKKFINGNYINHDTPLFLAIQRNNRKLVELLIEKGADFNFKSLDNYGLTPLHLAALSGNLDVVELLIEKGTDFKSLNNCGQTPLHLSASSGNLDLVKYLIEEKGADFTVKDRLGQTPLHLAAYLGHLKVIKYLIEEKGEDFNAEDNDGQTPLHLAAFSGHLDVVKYLIEEKGDNINVNAKNSQNQTPLQLAIKESHVGIVEALLNNGANIELGDVKLTNDEKIKEMLKQKLRLQEEITKSSECFSSTSSIRRKREAIECELSWDDDIEKIREGEEDISDISKLKINGDKFIDYIKDESISENKRTQLIQLAGQVIVTGKSQGLVNKLISNQRFINHLSKVGMISGITMQGMMAKNVLADAVNGNYQGLAINLGFIALPFGVKAGENAALKGLHSAAEIAYARGFKLAPLVESSLAQSFKLSSSFLARSTSAFIAYDLVKELRNGTVVGIVGDSVYLGVDAAELGIEVAEGFGVLEGVSSVTGPIGATIGAVVFVGTDVYQAIKKVENIDRLVHLTEEERLLEGIRAFIGIGTERHIEELVEEKQLYNQLVKQALEYLKQHNDIQRYVFPTGKLVQDTCNMVQYKEQCPSADLVGDLMAVQSEPTGLDIRSACNIDKNGNLFILKEREECTTKFQPDSDNTVILDEQKPDIKWSKIRPDNPSEGNLFCIPQGHGQLAPGLAYSCNNAIGIEYVNNRTSNYTLLDLGDGTDYARGFKDSNNIFFIGNGNKTIFGEEKDDTFILQSDRFEGKISGGNGTNTLDLSKFSPQSKSLSLNFRGSHLLLSKGLIDQISKVITRENKEDIISCKDVTLKYIDGRCGRNENEQDVITIEFDSCQKLFGTTIECRDYLSGKFIPKVQIMLRDYTTVNNYASKGNFSYFVDQKKGKASVDILSTSKNEFIFNNTLENIKAINFNSSDVRTIKFTFSPHNTETLISYRVQNISFTLNDGTVISVSKEGNLYALQNSNKSVDEIINSYAAIANNLKMSIFVHSLLNNESIVVGHGKHDVIENNPEYKSHLIGNGGENIFVVTSDKLPIPEIVLYDVDQENKIDTLDLRKIRKQVESDLNVKVKTRVITSGKDLIIQLFYEKDNEVSYQFPLYK